MSKKSEAKMKSRAITMYAETSTHDWGSLTYQRMNAESKPPNFYLPTRNAIVKEHWDELDQEDKDFYLGKAKKAFDSEVPPPPV